MLSCHSRGSPKKSEAGQGQQRDPRVADGPSRPSRRCRRRRASRSAGPAAADGRLGDQLLEKVTRLSMTSRDLVEEVQEERVGVAVGADRVVDVVEPAVQTGEVRRRRARGCPGPAAGDSTSDPATAATARTGRSRPARAAARVGARPRVAASAARGHGTRRLPRPTTTARISSSPTTPEQLAVLDDLDRLRRAASTARAASRTTTSGPSSGPSSASSGRGSRMIQRSVRTSTAARPDELAYVVVGGAPTTSSPRAALDHLAVAHDEDAVAQLERLGQVVGDEHHRLADLVVQPDDLVLHVPADQRVERRERLVEEQHVRVAGQRPARPTRCCIPPESWSG